MRQRRDLICNLLRKFGVALGAVSAFSLGVAMLAACARETDSTTATDAPLHTGELPCDVGRVLVTVCQQCHTAPPQNDAPFSLVTYADTQKVVSGKPIWQYMREAVETNRMPLSPAPLDAEGRETLLRWLRDGAPAAEAGSKCVTRAPIADAGAAAASDAAPSEPDAATTEDADAGATEDADAAAPVSESDAECVCGMGM